MVEIKKKKRHKNVCQKRKLKFKDHKKSLKPTQLKKNK